MIDYNKNLNIKTLNQLFREIDDINSMVDLLCYCRNHPMFITTKAKLKFLLYLYKVLKEID